MRAPKNGRKAARDLVLRRYDARLETFRPVDPAAFAPFLRLARDAARGGILAAEGGYKARVDRLTPLSLRNE